MREQNLNASQLRAIDSFLGKSSGVAILQGPPGTGKTTTITALLQQMTSSHVGSSITLVCAPSNKAVQVLAERFFRKAPNEQAILVGVEQKVPAHLRPIFLHTIQKDLASELRKIVDAIQALQRYELRDKKTHADFKQFSQQKHQVINAALNNIKRQIVTYQLTSLFPHIAEHQLDELERIFSSYLSSIAENVPPRYSSASGLSYHFTTMRLEEDNANSYLKQFSAALYNDYQQILTQVSQWQTEVVKKDSETFEKHLLTQAKVVFATLSVSGREQLLTNLAGRVGTLVVDEASQTVEAETLIAFQHSPKRVLLVGDTKQLPATVNSEPAKEKHYDWSMMWRLVEVNRCAQLMLDTQYRMHPEICAWPSRQYYRGQLRTAPETARVSLGLDSPLLAEPIAFYNIRSSEEGRGFSFCNKTEASYVVDVLEKIRELDQNCNIGVITFYSGQVDEIEQQITRRRLGRNVQVNTVDAFQGDENDIIILSFVRTNPKTIGFLKDFRRLNVAITRAKFHLIMMGNATSLEKQPSDVKTLIENLRERGFVFAEEQLRDRLGIPRVQPKPVARQLPKLKPEMAEASAAPAGRPHSKKKQGKQPKLAEPQIPQPAHVASAAAHPKDRKSVHEKSSKDSGKSAQKQKQPQGVCRFFNGAPDSCRKGDSCQFTHAYKR